MHWEQSIGLSMEDAPIFSKYNPNLKMDVFLLSLHQDSQGSYSGYDPFGQAPFSQPQPLGAARSNPFLSTASSGSSQDLDMQHFQELQVGFGL